MLARIGPSTALCLLSALSALVLPFAAFELTPSPIALVAVSSLALPFFVLCVASLIVSGWLAGVALVVIAVLTFIPWLLSIGVMAWFKPGLLGAVVLGTAMALVSASLAWLVRRYMQGGAVGKAAGGA